MRSRVATLFSFCLLLSGVSGCVLDQPLHSATGFTAHVLCSQTFVAGRDTDEIFRDYVLRTGGTKQLSGLLHYDVDPVGKVVRADLAGIIESRAIYREGRGCTLAHRDAPPPPFPSNRV